MVGLIPILLPIALVDSLSMTPLGLVALTSILAGPRRYATAFGLLSGLFFSYLIMALAFLFGLSAFLAQAKDAGLVTLKGHRSVGGMRASIYNAMPQEGIDKLVGFMADFEKNNG